MECEMNHREEFTAWLYERHSITNGDVLIGWLEDTNEQIAFIEENELEMDALL